MRAVVFHEHGGPEVLKLEERPDPVPARGEVLLRVRAVALNHLDIWIREGLPGPEQPKPHILGCDIAGEIVALGEDVVGRQVGEAVLISPGYSCGFCKHCRAGKDSQCHDYGVMGYQRAGGYAELVAVPAANAIPKPAGLSFQEAASVPLVFLTAYHMLFTRGRLKPGEDVLVMAAGSGVGIAATQLAKLAGARVIASAGSDEKLARAKGLGADDVINYRTADIASEARRLTGKKGVDLVIEHVGGELFQRCVAAMAKGGRLVTCGATAGPTVHIDLRSLFARQLEYLGSYMGSHWELMEVMTLFHRGLLKPVVDKVYPLMQAAEAQQRMAARQNYGKIVLVPA